jgi:hypothetical protein
MGEKARAEATTLPSAEQRRRHVCQARGRPGGGKLDRLGDKVEAAEHMLDGAQAKIRGSAFGRRG